MTAGTLAYLRTELARQHRSATLTLPRGLVVGMLAELLKSQRDLAYALKEPRP